MSSNDTGETSSLLVSPPMENNTPKRYERWGQYKGRGISDQERRRTEQLERQKQQRKSRLDRARQLVQQVEEDLSPTAPFSGDGMDTNVAPATPAPNEGMDLESKQEAQRLKAEERARKQEEKRIQFYRGQFMHPELLQEIPADLSGNWYIVPVPAETRRCLVISARYSTVARLLDGTLLKRFSSQLPCGSTLPNQNLGHNCILDCLFHEPSGTFFILDLLVWKGQLYYECETEFRFFWRNSKMQEVPEIHQVSHFNEHPFMLLPFYEADQSGLRASLEGSIAKEGALFFNKQGHYHLGSTPLVCYLPLQSVHETFANWLSVQQ